MLVRIVFSTCSHEASFVANPTLIKDFEGVRHAPGKWVLLLGLVRFGFTEVKLRGTSAAPAPKARPEKALPCDGKPSLPS